MLLEHLFILKHKSNIKEIIFELRSSHLIWDQLYKEIFEVNCQTCFNFTDVLSFTAVFDDFGHVFWTCFCRTSHNVTCNKFAILKNKRLTKILQAEKLSSYVISLSTRFRKKRNFLWLS